MRSTDQQDGNVSFECSNCKSARADPAKTPAWVRISGYESSCVRLCGCSEEQARKLIEDDDGTHRLFHDLGEQDEMPFGDKHVALVTHPFSARKGEPFWFLFQPPFSRGEGWRKYPGEIYPSSLLRCTLDSVLYRDEERAAIAMTELESVRIENLAATFPPVSGGGAFGDLKSWPPQDARVLPYHDFIHVEWDIDCCIFVWWLLDKTSGAPHLTARGVSSDHTESVWAGNYQLTTGEAAQLQTLLEKSAKNT